MSERVASDEETTRDGPDRTRGGRVAWTTWALVACQALYYGTVSVDLTLTAIVGLALAPTPALATLPLAMITLTGAAASVLAGLAAARFGYTAVMITGAVVGAVGGVTSVVAVQQGSFALLCVGTGIVGFYRATGGYIRFMAADLAPDGRRDRALSLILTGGLVAAVAGPWLATSTQEVLSARFAGSYLVVAVLCLTTVPLLAAVLPTEHRQRARQRAEHPAADGGRLEPVRVRELEHPRDFVTALLALSVAGAVMTMIMAIGPLGNQHAGHSAAMGASIIQWHLVGMFAPSLFSGMLLERFGRWSIAVTGAALLVLGSVAGATGDAAVNFLVALALNGLGWNFLFVAGSSYLVACYPPGRGGRLQAIAEGLGHGTAVLASFLASWVFLTIGWQGANVVAFVLPAALVAWLAFFRVRTSGAVA